MDILRHCLCFNGQCLYFNGHSETLSCEIAMHALRGSASDLDILTTGQLLQQTGLIVLITVGEL